MSLGGDGPNMPANVCGRKAPIVHYHNRHHCQRITRKLVYFLRYGRFVHSSLCHLVVRTREYVLVAAVSCDGWKGLSVENSDPVVKVSGHRGLGAVLKELRSEKVTSNPRWDRAHMDMHKTLAT